MGVHDSSVCVDRAGITGNQTIGDKGTSNENDLLDVLDFAFMINFQAQKNKWTLFSDINYVDLLTDAEVGPIKVDMGIKGAFVELGGMYRLANRPVGNKEGRSLSVDVLAAGRYITLEGNIDFQRLPDLERSTNGLIPLSAVV